MADGAGPSALLCQLGRHAPERLPIWNDGYYFSRCRRCGADIVRPLDGGWQVPNGYRVVWQADRPAGEATPLLKPQADVLPEAPEPEPEAEDVSDDFGPEEAAAEPVTPPEPPEPISPAETPAQAAARRSLIPDFMDDGSAGRVAPAVSYGLPAAPPAAEPRSDDRFTAASLSSMFGRIADAREREDGPATGRLARRRGFVVAAVLAFGAGALTVWGLGLTGGQKPVTPAADYRIPPALGGAPSLAGQAPERTNTPARTAVRTATPVRPARDAAAGADRVVTASVLNCRKAPSTGASVQLKMVRGVPLTALRKQGEWTLVQRRTHRCWVQDRLIGAR